MKKFKLLPMAILLVALIGSGCKKESTPESTGNNNNNNGYATLPDAFTKKVLVEEFTGEWCVNCPDGALYLSNIMTKYPTQVISAGVHQGDWLEISQLTALSNHLGGVAGYPRAAINRVPATNTSNGQDGMVVYSRGNWESNVARLIDVSGKTGKTGLAIETALNGDKLNVTVHCGYKANETRDTRLTVYIIENDITARNQIGATTTPYIHKHALRKVVTAATGDAIDMKTGSYLKKEYKDISLAGYDLQNVEVIAFINVVGSGSTQHEILNVQEVAAGENKNYD